MVRGVTYFEASNKVTADALTFDFSPLSPSPRLFRFRRPLLCSIPFYLRSDDKLFRFRYTHSAPFDSLRSSSVRSFRNERSGIPMKRSSLFHLPRSEAHTFIGFVLPLPPCASLLFLFLFSARTSKSLEMSRSKKRKRHTLKLPVSIDTRN